MDRTSHKSGGEKIMEGNRVHHMNGSCHRRGLHKNVICGLRGGREVIWNPQLCNNLGQENSVFAVLQLQMLYFL